MEFVLVGVLCAHFPSINQYREKLGKQMGLQVMEIV